VYIRAYCRDACFTLPGPALVAGIPLIASVATTRWRFTRTGALWAWGLNDVGQLGDQTTTTRLAPVIIDGIDDAVEAHGGRGYTVVRGNTA
jgi:alpha-tubulin suppressor-like RCC1 family protein